MKLIPFGVVYYINGEHKVQLVRSNQDAGSFNKNSSSICILEIISTATFLINMCLFIMEVTFSYGRFKNGKKEKR